MTVALVTGILAAAVLAPIPAGVGVVLAAIFAISGLFLKRYPAGALFCWLVPFGIFGAMFAAQRSEPAPNDVSRLAGQPSLWLVGTVAAEPEAQNTGNIRYPLEVISTKEGIPLSGIVLVTQTLPAGTAPRIGEKRLVRGRVELPPTATNPGGFDYRAYLWRKSIFATLVAKRRGDVQRGETTPGNEPTISLVSAALVRRSLLRSITHSPLSPEHKALVAGILLSEREKIAYAYNLAFERTGAVHLLSVSGLHLAVFAAVLSFLSRQLPSHRTLRKAGNLLAILLLWMFALAAGLSSATVRSAVMLTVILLAPVVRRDADPLHSLLVAAFVILLFDPLALYDVGAQLSFACVGGLLLWMTALRLWLFPLEYEMPRHVRIARNIVFVLLTGFVAQAAAAPLTAYHFSLISLIAPLAGVVLVPIAELLLITGLVTTGLSVFFALPDLFWKPLGSLCAVLTKGTQLLAAPDGAAFSVPPPSAINVVAFYVVFAGLGLIFRAFLVRHLWATDDKTRSPTGLLAALSVTGLILLPLLVVLPPVIASNRERVGRLRVTFLDVGQGDAAIVEAPDGQVVVVDGGGHPGTDERYGDPGSRTVVPFLRRRGIDRIDWLAPSHPDDDHVQGLIAVARAFPVDHVLDGGVSDDGSDACARLRELLRQKQVPIMRAQRGVVIPLGKDTTLEVLHPTDPLLTDTRSVTNANSEILRLRYKNAVFLFTGDCEEAAEASLLASGVSVRADVLKVGHHGSRFSSSAAFLRAVHPSIAVISSGRENNFGHPAPVVLEKLKAVDATIYRTDRQGAIVIETNGEWIRATPTIR